MCRRDGKLAELPAPPVGIVSDDVKLMDEPTDIDLLQTTIQQSVGRFSFIEVELEETALGDFARIVGSWRRVGTISATFVSRRDAVLDRVRRLVFGASSSDGALFLFGEPLLLQRERERLLCALDCARDRLVCKHRGPLVLVVHRGHIDAIAGRAPAMHNIRAGQFSVDADAASVRAASLATLCG